MSPPRATRLVVMIPCLDEAETLPATLAELPRSVPGIDEVRVLVIDDGSTDGTAEVARAGGADWVVRHRRNLGLARAFATGLREALARGADYVVLTDGDSQYPGAELPAVVAPLLAGDADIAVGDRRPGTLGHFSPIKRRLQLLGSRVVGWLAGFPVPDAASGFRAFTRDAALRLRVHTGFSASLETLVQAGRAGLSVAWVPIAVRPTPRPSRLHRGSFHYVRRQTLTLARALAVYEPLKTFGCLGLPFFLAGLALELRFLVIYLAGAGGVGRYIHSVTVGGFLITLAVLIWALGLLADGLLANRRTIEDALLRLETLERTAIGAGAAAEPEPAAAAPAGTAHLSG